jgi:ribosomal protein L12E/L44/L45/RPP1/RPP2
MSKLHQSDGLSILARYTSVAAIAIASSALPLKSGANDQVREDQAKVESSEDGQNETDGRSGLA